MNKFKNSVEPVLAGTFEIGLELDESLDDVQIAIQPS
jgi:hypothetical protein